jgi:SAM-dependent methyltransferase
MSAQQAGLDRELLENWPHEATELYLRDGDRIEAINGPFGAVMLDSVGLQHGERVLDVGCGCGTTTIDAARNVKPGGSAIGIDIARPLVDVARRRAAAAGLDNVEFVAGDAQVHPFAEADFDAVISRFGIMFFADPEAAFANLARATKPGGRLVVVCPADPMKSEWIAIAFAAAAPHVGLPDLGPPGAPGTFALADGQRLNQTIRAGGYREVTVEEVTRPVRLGDDADDVTEFITSLPEATKLFANKPNEKVAAAIDALRNALKPHAGADGVVMHETAWLASARR